MDRVLDVGVPGLVFVVLVFWLVRKVLRAARTESDLESERLTGALADELRQGKALAAGQTAPTLVVARAPLRPLDGADVGGASPEHLRIVEGLADEREAALRTTRGDIERRLEVLWVRSTATHVAWCERRHPATRAAAGMAREVICVARIANGKAVERWAW
jgi:hypothetical protein